MAVTTAAAPTPYRRTTMRWIRRRNDLWLSVAMGGIVALLLLRLPMEAALASAVVGAFIIIALVDTRVALLALLFVRSVIDVTATVPLLGLSGAANVNAAATMSFLVIGIGIAHIGISRLNVWRIPLTKPFVAYLLIAGIGIGIAPSPGLAIEDWLRAVSAFMIYILVVDLMGSKRDSRWTVRVLVLAAIIPVIAGIYQYLTDTGNHGTTGLNRLEGTFTHPAPYAFFLVGLLPLAIVYFLHTQSKIARLGTVLLIPGMVFCIYGSQTRGAWIGLAVLISVFLATKARWAVLLVPLTAAALFFALPSVQARFGEAGSDTGSVFWRQKQWQASLEVASPPQLLTTGAGLRAVDVQLGALSHNEYIRLLAETGVPGLLAVLLLYKGLLGIGIRGYREARTPYERDLMLAFLMAFAARAVTALADNILIFPVLEWYFWSLAGIAVVTSGAYQKHRLREPDVIEAEARAAA